MSHAVAVWIPGAPIEVEVLEQLVLECCAQHRGLEFSVFTRAEPLATCLVAPLDLHAALQLEFKLLDEVARLSARRFRRPTWSLGAFFGSADCLEITAFSKEGDVRWCEGSNDDPDEDEVQRLEKALGVTGVVYGMSLPYWKMMVEASSPPHAEDVLHIGIKPAFGLELIAGWQHQHTFTIPIPPPPPPPPRPTPLTMSWHLPLQRAPLRRVPTTEVEVLAGWTDERLAETQRGNTHSEVSREARSLGLSFLGVCEQLEAALARTLRALPWKQSPERLFIRLPTVEAPRYLSVKLGALLLHYPADLWLRTTDGTVTFETAEGAEASLPLSHAALLGELPPALERLLRATLPGDDWFFATLDLIRGRKLVPAAPKTEGHPWRVFKHPDGRVWSVAPSPEGFWLRLGAPDDDPVIKERRGEPMEPLVAEQLAEGFVEA